MPSRTSTATATAVKAPPLKRFELPALEFKFASLTEGTDIPPPPPSPVVEVPTPPATPPVEEEAKKPTTAPNGTTATDKPVNGIKRSASNAGSSNPASPTLSSRPGSIRRLISRTLLSTSYAEGGSNGAAVNGTTATNGIKTTVNANGNTVLAHANGSGVNRQTIGRSSSSASRRGSGWFRRLRSSEGAGVNKRASMIEDPRRLAGPPPPMIPEVDIKEEATLGSDWIREIKVE